MASVPEINQEQSSQSTISEPQEVKQNQASAQNEQSSTSSQQSQAQSSESKKKNSCLNWFLGCCAVLFVIVLIGAGFLYFTIKKAAQIYRDKGPEALSTYLGDKFGPVVREEIKKQLEDQVPEYKNNAETKKKLDDLLDGKVDTNLDSDLDSISQ